MRFFSLIVACVLSASAVAAGPRPPAAAVFAQPVLAGMQLSIKRGAQQGKVPPKVASCVAQLDAASFDAVFVRLLAQLLTADEVRAADAFFASPTGVKLGQFGLAQFYKGQGEPLAQPEPQFSAEELKQIEDFGRTGAGEKLMVKRLLDGPTVKPMVTARIQELLAACER